MISQDALPEGLLARCLDVLRQLSPNERDLIRVVVEVIHELRDSNEEEEPSVSMFYLALLCRMLNVVIARHQRRW